MGVVVGHATDTEGATGLTVIRGKDAPLRGGVAVFGRASGGRELLTLAPEHVVGGRVDAVLLTGGSAYGLDAAAGVVRWLEEHRRGFPVRGGVVPIVPAAVIFDLAALGRFEARPTPQMAYEAAARASDQDIDEGSVGVGTGATVGKIAGDRYAMKGGFGYAVHGFDDMRVAAFVVVNALGDVRDADGRIIAGARNPDGGFLDTVEYIAAGRHVARAPVERPATMQNTTLAVVVSKVPLGALELGQLARSCGAALFRRITPVASAYDGDMVFALSPDRSLGQAADLLQVEVLAALALGEAIERAVRMARGRDHIPGLAG